MDQNNKDNGGIGSSNTSKDSSTDVEFDSDQQYTQSFYPKTPKIIQWTIKYSGGLIKDEEQANYALLGFVALSVVISLFLVFGGESNQPTQGQVPIDQFVP